MECKVALEDIVMCVEFKTWLLAAVQVSQVIAEPGFTRTLFIAVNLHAELYRKGELC